MCISFLFRESQISRPFIWKNPLSSTTNSVCTMTLIERESLSAFRKASSFLQDANYNGDAFKLPLNFFLAGQEIIDQYVHLIQQCVVADPEAIMALCQWKNRRSIFCTEKEEKKLPAGRRQYSTINEKKLN